MMYDPEAIYQDADIEQAEMEREGRRLAALEKRGTCTHGRVIGIGEDGVAHYPEAVGLVHPQVKCDRCGRVFADDDDWLQAIDNLR